VNKVFNLNERIKEQKYYNRKNDWRRSKALKRKSDNSMLDKLRVTIISQKI
jgi:hypothetical protein